MNDAWLTMNQRHLAHAVASVRYALQRHTNGAIAEAPPPLPECDAELAPPALEALSTTFGLTLFERSVLVLAAGVELESGFDDICARAFGNPALRQPTFSLALATLPDPHWSALSPDAPLRRWRLIDFRPRDEPLTLAPLRISERVLHYLAGVACEEEELRGWLRPVESPDQLPPSQHAKATEIARLMTQTDAGKLPVIQLCGRAGGDARLIAAVGCRMLGLGLRALTASDLPARAAEREQIAQLWEREAALAGWGLLIEVTDWDNGHELGRTLAAFVERVHGVVLVSVRESLRDVGRPSVRIDVARPRPAEQRVLWQAALGDQTTHLNGTLDHVLSHFDFSARHVRAVSTQALLTAGASTSLEAAMWEACRSESRPQLEGLAQRLAPTATWSDLVLPAPQLQTLREISAQLRQRHLVYETWGFAAKGTRGLGVTALFAGASGTGKTFAAEVLAAEARLDLFRIDLSQVVSKYIGETEKNLRRVFDAAEGSGAILLFDEADALFGKRSEVKDSHDRFANIEVSYLLQQMEAYRGLAILTTNLKHALDPAFLRRIRFVVQFPFPGTAERAELWRRVFPSATPTDALDLSQLARLNVTGGNIRNIAVNAAFLAADAGSPVRMTHLLAAARSEYEKLEKPLTATETGGWV